MNRETKILLTLYSSVPDAPKGNLGHLLLGNILRNNGYDVELVNTDINVDIPQKIRNTANEIDFMADYLISKEPTIIGLYTICDYYEKNILLANVIKKKRPDIKVAMGGPQAGLTAEVSMKAFPWIDLISIGEGENIILPIIKALEGNGDFDEIPNILYRKDGKLIINEYAPQFPDIENQLFMDYNMLGDIKKLNEIPIEAGRGCPFTCKFCSTKTFFNRKYRLKSTDRLIAEMCYVKERYGFNVFTFKHDLMTFNKEKVIEFCDKLIELDLGFKWNCSSRVDTIDEELMRKMSKAGCHAIFFGIESGSEKIQRSCHKNLKVAQIREVVELLAKHDMTSCMSFIYLFPDETEDDLRQTLNILLYCLKRSAYRAPLSKCQYLAGTEYTNEYMDQLVLIKDKEEMLKHYSEEEYEMIKNYPNIFPQHYTIITPLSVKYDLLDDFIKYYSKTFKKRFYATFQLILAHYNNELLDFFNDFKQFMAAYNHGSSELDSLLARSMDIKNFIEQKPFNDIKITEMFRYEYDLILNSYINKAGETIQYKFDVVEFRKRNPFSNLELDLSFDYHYPIQIEFSKEGNKLVINKYIQK